MNLKNKVRPIMGSPLKYIQRTLDSTRATLKGQWKNTINMLRENNSEPRVPYSAKISFGEEKYRKQRCLKTNENY